MAAVRTRRRPDLSPGVEWGMTSHICKRFNVGDRVVKDPAGWKRNCFEPWRGKGVGVVVEPPFGLEPDTVDVRWFDAEGRLTGRYFEPVAGLRHAPPP